MTWVPTRFVCCKMNRQEKAFDKAREKLEKELNVIELIKSRRYFAKALKMLVPPETRLRLREQTRYLLIDPESDDSGLVSDFEKSTSRYTIKQSTVLGDVQLSSGHFSERSYNDDFSNI